jgi:hypothetical protein
MSQTTQTQPTWKAIIHAALAKSKDDYQSKLKPAVNSGRTKIGSWIETIGRKIQS